MVEMADCTGLELGQTGQGLQETHRSLERGRSMNLGLGQQGSHMSPVTPVVMRAGYS